MKNRFSSEDDSRPGVFEYETNWFRYSAYELNGGMIIPKKGSHQIIYHPSNEPDLLEDFLNLGKFLDDELNNTMQIKFNSDRSPAEINSNMWSRNSQTVLRFCDKYGLLGEVFDECVYSDKNHDYFVLIEPDNDKRSYIEHIKPFFPNGLPKNVEPIRSFERKGGAEYYQGYGEPYADIILKAHDLYILAKLWKYYSIHKPNRDDAIDHKLMGILGPCTIGTAEPVWGDALYHISMLDDVCLVMNPFKDKPQLLFHTKNLDQFLRMQFLVGITSSDRLSRLCNECNKAFKAKDPRALYCSDTCSARFRKRRLRKAQKTAALSTQKTVVKTVGELSTKQGKTGEKPRKRKTR
jgi:hypothetical protein